MTEIERKNTKTYARMPPGIGGVAHPVLDDSVDSIKVLCFS